MKLLLSEQGSIDYKSPGQGMMDLKNAGLTGLMADRSIYDIHRRNLGKDSEEYCEKLCGMYERALKRYREEGFQVELICTLQPDEHTADAADNALYRREALETLRLAKIYGIPYVLIPPLYIGISREQRMEENRRFYRELAEKAEGRVMILITNQFHYLNGLYFRGIFTDEVEAAAFIDRMNAESGANDPQAGECFGFCLHSGYASFCGKDMHEMAVTLGHRIKAVILSDGDGQKPQYRLPYTCGFSTDWLPLVRGMREIDFDGLLIMAVQGTLRSIPTFVRQKIYPLVKGIGEFFIWQMELEKNIRRYDWVVLFGAGNMCRNYMKCYSDIRMPLFTCDNNSALWGTIFEGLEVHDPRDLRDLPENTGVFICNIYYREIEAQLREMGVKNIEFFNDEYMPTLYFDRYDSVMGEARV